MPVIRYTEAQIALAGRRGLEAPLLGLVYLGILIYCLAADSVFYAVAATLAVGLNILAVRRTREVYVNTKFVTAAVLLATVQLILELAMTGLTTRVLLILGRYLVIIQLCKLFQRKSNRDYVQLLAMNLLLVTSLSLVFEALSYALVLVAYLALAVYTTMAFTLKRGLDAASTRRLSTEAAPLPPQPLTRNAVRNWPVHPLWGRTGVATVSLLAAAGVVFLLAPRLEQPAARAAGADSVISGFAAGVQLGRPTHLKVSNEVLMRFHVRRGTPGQGTYLPAQRLDAYQRSSWYVHWPMVLRGAPRAEPAPLPESMLADTMVLSVSMKPALLPHLFAPHPTLAVNPEQGGARIIRSEAWVSTGRVRPDQQFRYEAYCLPQPLTEEHMNRLNRIRRYRLGPSTGPAAPLLGARPQRTVVVPGRVRDLARQWCADLLGGRRNGRQGLAIANRIRGKLAQRCKYTLDLTEADPGCDGVEDFLFNMRKGHCEYFASALTLMCRSLGVRARLVTGFRVNEFDPQAGEYLVRARDAHAWTEVHTDHADWVVVDATPGGPPGGEGSWWERAADYWQELRFLWQDKVLGYNEAARERLGRWVIECLSGLWAWITATAADITNGAVRLVVSGQVSQAMMWLAAIIGAAGLIVEALVVYGLLRKGAASRREVRRKLGISMRQLRFMVGLFRLLRRRGIRCERDQTMMEFAAGAAEKLHLPPELLTDLIDLYYRLRWGPPGEAAAVAAQIAAAEGKVSHLRELLAGASARPISESTGSPCG